MTWDQPRLTNLRKILAPLYPREAAQRRIVHEAGLDETLIAFDPSAANTWSEILKHASHRDGKVDAILRIALDEHPENELLARAKEPEPPTLLGDDLAITWEGPKNSRPLLEKIIGEASTLVPVSYLAVGLKRARAVAKVKCHNGSCGSGFLVKNNLLVTSHHVIESAEIASQAVAIFDFQQNEEGLAEEATTVRLRPDLFFETAKEHDWTAVRVESNANDRWGALDMQPASVREGDRVNIIQHPGGGYKQLSFYANAVAFVGHQRVQYLTDTLPGSSGSPVFDRFWRVVALHHGGGWLPEPGKDTTHTFFRNQGVLIDAVIDGLTRAGGVT
ncbi:trypsin-like peptidase domain-containing protein [Polyangium sp. 15x6]|uniref:trypsin-like peptidase domain-containing protein n=1 Tax=Polyangium sp. 15x6 TaxID=3042687 RepID=UPI00249A2434|nr:trypsin-like peptidase domain-containing protein [Polyangium sp. 15x6]MDI3292045.1 trypsin-like peptidase domain-containing protein [Polyangium sp. 15x6]